MAHAYVGPLRTAVLGLGAVYVLSLVPGIRGDAGFVAAFDIWANGFFRAGVIAVLVVQGMLDPRLRVPWWCLAAGLATALAGSIGYWAHYRHLDPVPYPSWSDIGWVAFYPLAYAALIVGFRRQSGQMHRGMWLDAAVAGLAAAALAAAFALEPALEATDGDGLSVAMTLAYPIADLILIALLVGGLALTAPRLCPRWWIWLAAGLAIFFVTDAIYVQVVARGTYSQGDPLDAGWALARICFVVAAWWSLKPARRRQPPRIPLLLAPGAAGIAAVAVLFYGTRESLGLGAALLAGAAVIAGLARTVLIFREVRALAESRRQAATDELTGLANRRHFLAALRSAGAADARRYAVLLVDLDRFKDVNDSLGHPAGDELLRLVADRLAAIGRSRDVVARLGGDEFALLALGVSAGQAEEIARRVREAVAGQFELGSARLSIDASVGIALAPDHSGAADELLQLADLAMYAAKGRGGGVHLYDEERDGRGRHRLELVTQLREGIARDELFLVYQPKLDLRTGRTCGVEALVRWRHPSRGTLTPHDFVDLAESAGLMQALTTAVLTYALAQSRAWREAGLDLRVSVNISPSDLIDPMFAVHLSERLARERVPPDRVVLELTESHVMEDRYRAVEVIERLRAIGVGVAIDDFGTGYSSLAYLVDLPVTELKLDRALIAPITNDPRASSIVRSAIQLAAGLGLRVVAEGVEDEPTLQALREMQCPEAQGFYIARPMHADAIAASTARALQPAARVLRGSGSPDA